MQSLLRCFVFPALLLTAVPSHAQFVNGDFSQQLPGGAMCNAGVGWTYSTTGPSINWPWPEHTGYPSLSNLHIDLTNCGRHGNGIWIQQTVPTTPGTCYRLKVDLGTLCGWDGSDAGVYVTANGIQVGPRVFNDSFICQPDTVCWKTRYSVPFLATGPATTIRLTGEGRLSSVSPVGNKGDIGNPGYIGVDNVSLVPVTSPDILASLGTDTALCLPFRYALDAGTAATRYRWSTGDTTPAITATQPGTYWVQATGLCAGTASDTIVIREHPLPRVTLPGRIDTCRQAITLTPVIRDASSLRWSSGTATPVLEVTRSGTYTLQATNLCGTTSATTTVTLEAPLPNDLLPPTLDLCGRETLLLQAPADSTAQWRWSGGSTQPALLVREAGVYALEGTNACGAVRDQVQVVDCPGEVWVPTAFSPNGDGWNDDWGARASSGARILELAVYDRWGALLFYERRPDARWNGTQNGAPLPAGVYFYRLRFEKAHGRKVESRKGDVTLVR